LVEGLQWLGGGEGLRVAGKAAISQARSRLGAAVSSDSYFSPFSDSYKSPL
jgi:hypothetical protein